MSLSVKTLGARSVLDGLRQQGSLKALFPRVTDGPCQAIMVNTAGGITGGDRFELTATAGTGAALTLSTQASERAYAAQPGETGRLTTRLRVEAGATLNWLPQETILFDRSALHRRLEVELAADARLLLCEPLVFGRAAMGETLRDARFRDRIAIRRAGAPLYTDATQLSGDIAARLARPAVAKGAGAMAQVVLVAPEAEAQLDPVRDILRGTLPESAGASLIGADVLAIRMLAPESHLLRRALIPVLTRLSRAPLPRCWTI